MGRDGQLGVGVGGLSDVLYVRFQWWGSVTIKENA